MELKDIIWRPGDARCPTCETNKAGENGGPCFICLSKKDISRINLLGVKKETKHATR